MNILGITVSSTLIHYTVTFQLLLAKALVHCMLSRPFVLTGSTETRCGTLHVLHWSHNSCMLALPDEKNRLQSIIKKAIRFGFLPRTFSTLSELSEDSDEKLFRFARYNHVLHCLLPQPKTVQYNLSKRTHDLTLPTDVLSLIHI